MELVFQLNEEDYSDMVAYARKRVDEIANTRARLSTLAWAFYLFLAMAAIALLYFISESKGQPLKNLYAALALLAMSVSALYWHSKRHYALHLKYFNAPDGYYQQETRITTEESGITVFKPASKHIYEWAAIKAVGETPRQIILHVDNAQGVCVARGAFASPEAANDFVTYVRKCIGSAANT